MNGSNDNSAQIFYRLPEKSNNLLYSRKSYGYRKNQTKFMLKYFSIFGERFYKSSFIIKTH